MFEWDSLFGLGFNLLYLFMVIGTIIVVVLDNRHPVKTIAWILVLLFLPLVGLIFYFFFGQNVRRKRLISKRIYNNIVRRPLHEYWRKPPADFPKKGEALANLFRRMNRSLPYGGNQVKFFTDGAGLLHALLRAIADARHHIHLEYYIIEDDAVGRMVRDALIDKVKQGVKVRLLYDDVGCWRVAQRFFREMIKAGVEVYPFLEVRFPIFSNKVNYRNHRKIVVIDGAIGFVGGMNLAERYVQGVSWGVWRDTSCMIYGTAVHGLQTVFMMDWFFVTRQEVDAKVYFPRLKPIGDSYVQIVTSKPVGRWRDIMQGYLWAICNAKRYLYIQTPYFMPDEQILTALQTAALSGVDVRIMLPRKSDSRVVQMCSLSFLRDLMEAGVKFYFYGKGFLHAKMMVMDDSLSTVGSANIDFRSFEHNFEVNAFFYDTKSAIRLREAFENDLLDSEFVSSKRWNQRPFWRKVEESILRMLAPLL